LDEKDKEINDLKQINSDLEIQLSKLKTSLNESKKNHDYLLNNYKSAEKLSYFQNKVSQLSEEKAVILQTNSEAIRNLINEINELNLQMNECKKKELDYLKKNSLLTITTNSVNEEKQKNQQNNNLSKDTSKNNKAELFFEKEVEKNPDNKNPENKKKEKNLNFEKNLFEDCEEDFRKANKNETANTDNIQDSEVNNASDSPNPNAIPSSKSSEGRKEQGFFTRFIAPIFLTENELNNLNQD